MSLRNYHRNLPHIQSDTATYFVTYRLANSIPMQVLNEIKSKFNEPSVNSSGSFSLLQLEINKNHFFTLDSFLDNASNGPYWLQNPLAAREVYASLIHLNVSRINLKCFTIMSNHVHSLFSIRNPSEDLFKIMQSHKSFTAKKCNEILNRTGKFWEEESFDRIVRKGKMENAVNYILQNPVKAGLVKKWEDWPWTFLA